MNQFRNSCSKMTQNIILQLILNILCISKFPGWNQDIYIITTTAKAYVTDYLIYYITGTEQKKLINLTNLVR